MPEKKQTESQRGPAGARRTCLDNVFSSQRPMFSLSQRVWNPPADVMETRDSMVIKMEVAGIRLDTLEITSEGHFLIVRGCRHEDTSSSKENYHVMEIRYGAFERFFSIPYKVDPDHIDAQYANGFLVVTIAKKPVVARRIPVKSVD